MLLQLVQVHLVGFNQFQVLSFLVLLLNFVIYHVAVLLELASNGQGLIVPRDLLGLQVGQLGVELEVQNSELLN